jgi:hypothetical protein
MPVIPHTDGNHLDTLRMSGDEMLTSHEMFRLGLFRRCDQRSVTTRGSGVDGKCSFTRKPE